MKEITDRKKPAAVAKTVLKILLWACVAWAAVLVLLQAVLSPSVLTRIADKYADRFVEGNISFGKAEVSMFRNFPNIAITLEDFAVTYPSGRFDSSSRAGVGGYLLNAGCSDRADTLASFKSFSVTINPWAMATGSLNIPHACLVKPRIFIHNYAGGQSNLNILKFGAGSDDEDTDSSPLKVKAGKIQMGGHPHVVYTDSKDTVFAMADFKCLDFNGRLDAGNMSRNKIGMHLDSLFLGGRTARDTVALSVDRLHIHEHKAHMDISAQMKSFSATRMFGRMMIPVSIDAGLSFPKDSVPAISLSHFDIDVASLPLEGRADIRLHEDRIAMDGELHVHDCRLESVIRDIVRNFIPQSDKISTDAVMTACATFSGDYVPETGLMPDVNVTIDIPEASIGHCDISQKVRFNLSAEASTVEGRKIKVNVGKASIRTSGLSLEAKGESDDILADDPRLNIDGNLSAVLDTIASIFIPDSLNVTARGRINAGIKGTALLSQFDIYNFSGAELSGKAILEGVCIQVPEDSLDLDINSLELNLAPEIKKLKSENGKSIRMLAINGKLDSTYITYRNSFEVIGKDVSVVVKNSSGNKSETGKAAVNPLGIRLNAKMLSIKDSEGSAIAFDQTENGFLMYPKKGHGEIPVMTATSSNKRIFLRNADNRAILTDASVKVKAAMNTIERKQRAKAIVDSLATVYPDVPRDSLFAHARSRRASVPDWMKEDDFRKKDPDLKLESTLAKYFREWDLNGNLNVRTGILMTPYFPLRNIIKGCEVSFDNNRVAIDTFAVASGNSKIAAKGSLTGIKRTLLGRNGTLKLDLDMTSSGMDANELFKAYSSGSKYVPKKSDSPEDISNAEFLKKVTTEAENYKDTTSLIVVPGNMNADIRFNAGNITYSGIQTDTLTARLLMKERCIQITDTKAVSNAGDISFDGFYSTRSKNDIKTGFNLNLTDITAEKFIGIMPAVDTIMPMLKSFRGLLNCELAATANLDTNMNIVMPSINGVMRIGGEHLTINDNDMFSSLARKLMFKNKKTGFIDNMTVEGVIRDNMLEVFPFVLTVGRYTLAMSGIQNLDKSFRYHISVLKSPILIRLGIDLSGDDFDHMKFRIGKAKYKDTNVPVFSSVIDDTKINLLKSIRGIFEKGVEAAVSDNSRQEAIEERKKELGYVNAVDQELEPLSEQEQQQLEAEQAADTDGQDEEK